MKNIVDLTKGNISKRLMQVAFPIMMISFMQMAYNMIDMMWLGWVSHKAVAAAGTAGFFLWISVAFVQVSKTGAEVKVSQSIGAKDEEKAREYARSAILLGFIMAVSYGFIIILLRKSLIGIIKIQDQSINDDAAKYLIIVAIGFIFNFYNQITSSVYYGVGRSKIPLIFSMIGLSSNIVLDYLLIFGKFGLPKLGVIGAAIATVISQIIITILFIIHVKGENSPFPHFHVFKKPNFPYMKTIIKLGYPVGIMRMLHSVFSIIIARKISEYGSVAISVQRVGIQIESISWMTAGGLQSAVRAFTGQNLGANQINRIKKGFYNASGLVLIFGIVVTFVMFVFAKPLFGLFLPYDDCIAMGTTYLQILALSQLFMMFEMMVSGAFNGLGHTKYPSMVTIILTGARVPLVYILGTSALLGLNGIWWSISMSSVAKGLVLFFSFVYLLRKRYNGT